MCPELLPLGSGENKSRPRLKMVGVGGAGCNAIANSAFESIGLCASSDIPGGPTNGRRIILSEDNLRFVRGTSPKLITSIDHEVPRIVAEAVGDSDLIFVFTGLGGETGSYATPGIVQICKKLSHLVIVSAALPFSVEGSNRRDIASRSLGSILDASHLAITYPNDGLLKIVPNLPLRKAFKVMDGIMMVPAMELFNVLTVSDLPLLKDDFAAVSYLRLGVGTGRGDQREAMAVEEAFSSPWFDFDRNLVKSAIVIISSDDPNEVTLKRVLRDISNRIPNAKIRYGMRKDESMVDKVKITTLLGVGDNRIIL